jgi:hypothetical protein
MAEVRDFIRAAKNAEWTSRFYQYGNRLAHLYWLKEKNGIPSYLINIYFYNDIAQKGPNEIAEWKGAIALLHTYFGIGKHKLSKNMLEIFIDVNKLK